MVGEVLDALKVEGLDDAVGAEVVLRAALGRLDGRPLHARAVDLSDPEAEPVELPVDGGRHREVDRHLGRDSSIGSLFRRSILPTGQTHTM